MRSAAFSIKKEVLDSCELLGLSLEFAISSPISHFVSFIVLQYHSNVHPMVIHQDDPVSLTTMAAEMSHDKNHKVLGRGLTLRLFKKDITSKVLLPFVACLFNSFGGRCGWEKMWGRRQLVCTYDSTS
jgi:hypothetical protein